MATAVSEINLGVAEPVGVWFDYRKLGRRLASFTAGLIFATAPRRS